LPIVLFNRLNNRMWSPFPWSNPISNYNIIVLLVFVKVFIWYLIFCGGQW